MRTSNAAAARVLRLHGITACVSVGEHGLLGHLDDMAQAACVSTALWPDLVPALSGALELAAAGVIAPATARQVLAQPNVDAQLMQANAAVQQGTALLADPQISGGLLAALPPARADACLAALRDVGVQAAIIGVTEPATQGAPTIRLESGRGGAAAGSHSPDLLVSAD